MSVGGDDLRGQGTDLVVAAPFFVVGAERSGTTLLRLMPLPQVMLLSEIFGGCEAAFLM